MEPGTFICSICGDSSRSICVYCTKDACGNHLCERCRRCSDCCECGVPIGKPNTDAESELPVPATLSHVSEDAPSNLELPTS